MGRPLAMHRTLVSTTLAALLLAAPGVSLAADPHWASGQSPSAHAITVYRSASCGCCKGWVSHLREHNFRVDEVVTDDLAAVKQRLGVAPDLAACHTAEADGRVFEGHVPANDVKSVLEGEDTVRLLAVPGMPSGSPGMDFPGARKDAFEVIAEDRAGVRRVYRTHSGY